MISDAKARRISSGDKPLIDTTIKGLYLFPSAASGRGKWIFRFSSPETGKRREKGLGTYPEVSIKHAREIAFEHRRAIDSGVDPLEQRERALEVDALVSEIPSFEFAARRVHKDLSPGFRNGKHTDQWLNTLVQYVFPFVGSKPVNEITVADFANSLRPIWLTKPETASRIKQRCDAVMKWCAANGYIVASPVSVVDQLLPSQPSKRQRVEHHPAVLWRDLPYIFRSKINTGNYSDSQLMLEIVILTACRSGEVRFMEWGELDLANNVWTIPASRMKAKRAHRVPLTPRILDILDYKANTRMNDNPLVFYSRTHNAYSDMTLTKFLRDKTIQSDTLGRIATAHGFRSTFRDWASENGYSREVAERALAHTISNATEAAYHRTDLLDKRREMMEAWEKFVMSE